MKAINLLILTLWLAPMATLGQFIPKPLNFPSTLHNVYTYSIIDDEMAWFGADHVDWSTFTIYNFPYAVKTSDGGETWQFDSIPMAGSIIAVQELSAVDENICYYVLTDSDVEFKVWKTMDGGSSWEQKTTTQFAGIFIDFIHAFSADTVTAFGDVSDGYWEIQWSVDGGDTWTRVPSGNIPAPLSGEYSNWRYHSIIGDTVWFATSRGRCYKSTDRGLIWTVSPVITVNGVECDVKFASVNNGIFFKSAASGGTRITNDGGFTWIAVTIPGNKAIISASPVEGWPAGFIYTTATPSPGLVDVYFTPDQFSTNILVSGGIASSGYLSFTNAGNGWLSGSGTMNDDIYKYDGLLTAIHEAGEVNLPFSIIPNPSRGSALVWLGGGNDPGTGTIDICNISGQKLFSQVADSRSGWASLEASRLENGIYIVVYRAGNGQIRYARWIVQH